MSSLYTRILDAVASRLNTIPLLNGAPIRKRKRPYVDRQRGESLPSVIVSPRRERIESNHFDNTLVVDYPVIVSVVSDGNLLLLNPEWALDMREAVRKTLYKTTLDGVSEVFDCNYEPEPSYDYPALDTSLDVSIQQFIFRAQEQRSNT